MNNPVSLVGKEGLYFIYCADKNIYTVPLCRGSGYEGAPYHGEVPEGDEVAG